MHSSPHAIAKLSLWDFVTLYTVFTIPPLPQHKSKANNSLGIVKYHTCSDLYPIFFASVGENSKAERSEGKKFSIQFRFGQLNKDVRALCR